MGTLLYRGQSMLPTFRELDLICYQRDCPVKAGDVVAFSLPGDRPCIVVHRVMKVTEDGLVTRGDNGEPDPDVVPISRVLGVVRAYNRNGRLHKVSGGVLGKAVALQCVVRRQGRRTVRKTVGSLYRYMVSHRVVSRWTSPYLGLRHSRFIKGGFEEDQLHHRAKAIGIRRPGADRWHIYFPYALIVDADSLPRLEEREVCTSSGRRDQ